MNYKLLIYILVLCLLNWLLKKTENYNFYRKLTIILLLILLIISFVINDSNISIAMTTMLMGLFYEIRSEKRQKNILNK